MVYAWLLVHELILQSTQTKLALKLLCFVSVKFMYFCDYPLFMASDTCFFINGATKFYFKINKPSTMPFMSAQKMKYLGVNLSEYVQNLYAENYTTFMKGIKEYLSKWRCTLDQRLSTVQTVSFSSWHTGLMEFYQNPSKLGLCCCFVL